MKVWQHFAEEISKKIMFSLANLESVSNGSVHATLPHPFHVSVKFPTKPTLSAVVSLFKLNTYEYVSIAMESHDGSNVKEIRRGGKSGQMFICVKLDSSTSVSFPFLYEV